MILCLFFFPEIQLTLQRGCSDDALPWQGPSSSQSNDKDNSTEDIPWLHTYEPYLCTAISNAILNKCSDTVRGCTLYCMSFPSSDCSKLMVQSQIATVVVLGSENEQTSPDLQASRILLDMAGVQVRYYQPNRELVTLNFSSPSSSAVQEQPQTNNETKNATSNTNLVTDRERAILKEEIDYDPLHSENGSKKRTDYLSWKDYFMAMAFLTSQRSKDPNTQVGACIVDSSSNRILGLGYNGFPVEYILMVLCWLLRSILLNSHTILLFLSSFLIIILIFVIERLFR